MLMRIVTLDWLRGLMALSIMFYHLVYWYITPLPSNNPLGRLGIYGVSIFFLLSGLSMAIVYNNYLKNIRDIVNFYLRRIFRIWPLLWIATILTLLPQFLATGYYDWKIIFLNLTTLFGFYRPTNNIATGAWSIGNEMVYYALTPFIFYFYNKQKKMGNILCLIAIGIALIFAFSIIETEQSIQDQ
jgi:exopolysaccharide production protein ExoZ